MSKPAPLVLIPQNVHVTRLTDSGKVGRAAISLDGRYIAYSFVDAEQYSLRVRSISTRSDVQVLAPQPLEIAGVTFSPDGDYIYFVRSKKTLGYRFYLYRIPVLGGTEEMILENIDTRVSFSPDGHQFAFMRGQSPTNLEIHFANSDGSDDRSIATLKAFLDPRFINGVSWSPDGKTIVIPTLHGPKDEKFLSLEGIQHELLNLGDFIGVPAWLPMENR